LRKFLLLICLLLVSQQAAAWLITGDSVLEEDSQFSLTVTPHTATSPVKKFAQTFVLCNKTASAQTVYAAYLFNSALKSGKVEYWQQPAFGWVSKEFVCPAGASFVYQLNKFPGAQNPSWAKCYTTIHDTNGYAPDRNQVFFDGGFKTGSIPTRTINFDENKLVSGNTWLDVTTGFTDNKQVLNGKHIYPYTAGLSMPANACKEWRISYEPAASDDSSKWDLWLWAGTSWNCILNGTCAKVVKLDPWWNANWASKKAIQLPNQDMNAGETIQIEGINFSGMNVLANLNDVRVVDENLNVELDRLCDGTSASTDGNCFFFTDYNFTKNDSDMNTTYYLYYGNPVAGAPPDSNVERARVCNFELGNCEISGTTIQQKAVVKFGMWDGSTITNGAARFFDSSFSTNGMWDWNYSGWIRAADATQYSVFRISAAVDHVCSIGVFNDAFYILYNGDESEAYFGTSADDTWYKFIIHYKDGDANCGYQIKDSTGADLIPPFSFSKATSATIPIKVGTTNYSATNTTYISNIFRGMPFKAVGLGALEQSASAVGFDLNIWKISGYDVLQHQFPIFDFVIDSNMVIDFNVSNVDNNAMKVDINYSTSATQGTGTVIVQDLNLSTGVCPLAQQWTSPVPCSWDWNYSAIADGNYYILMNLKTYDSNANSFDVISKSFKIISPYVKLQVFDENLGFALSSPTVTFAGQTFALDSAGKLTLGTGPYSGRYTIAIADDGNYSARYFDFDLNASTRVDLNVFLLKDGNSTNVAFKFYDMDQETIIASKLIRLKHDNNICSMRYTNTAGETSFILDADDNYVFEIVKTGTNVLFYYPTLVTIQIPKNVATLASVTPFSVKGQTLTTQSWIESSSAIPFYILSNTVAGYNLDVNDGSAYSTSHYSINLKGNPPTYSLQPYLVSGTTGVTVIFNVRDDVTTGGLADIKIVSMKNIAGIGIITVEEAVTDSAGQASLSFVANDTYYLYFYDGNVLRYNMELRPPASTTQYQVYLRTATTGAPMPIDIQYTISFTPNKGIAWVLDNNRIDLNQSIDINNASLQTVRVKVINGSTTVYDVTKTGGDANYSMFFSQDINALTLNWMKPLVVEVTVTTTEGYYTKRSTTYAIHRASSPFGSKIIDALQAFAANDLGASQVATTIIAIFITLLVVGSAAVGSSSTDLSGLSILGMMVLGFFAWIGWVHYGAFVLACIAAFSLFVITRGFER
jgi:hypothetical protein